MMSLPRNTIVPCDEISRRIASPSVVLPDPDSPTMPSVSPWRTAMSTPSTALMWPTTLRRTPRLIGNQTLRSSVSTMTGASGRTGAGSGRRLGRQQRARVGVLRRREHLFDRTALDDLAFLHDAEPVGKLAHDAEVVGDEQHRHAHAPLQVLQQREDLRLHGDVERGRRLVGDQKVWLVGERHGDHDALALAAGKLVRIAGKPRLRLGNADLGQKIERARARSRAGDALVEQENFADLLLDGVQRIERGHRLLEDDRDIVAAHVAHFALPATAAGPGP